MEHIEINVVMENLINKHVNHFKIQNSQFVDFLLTSNVKSTTIRYMLRNKLLYEK